METNTLHQHRRLLVRGIDQPNVNRTNLMKDNFLARFVLFFVFLRVVLSVSPVEETFPQEKCETALLTCQCEDYGDVVGIECHNMTNFESFARILSDGSVFEVNTTFEIALSGAQVLPRSFLKGLIVRRLLIDDAHTEVVSDGAFDGAWQLDRFQVILSSIKKMRQVKPLTMTSPIWQIKNNADTLQQPLLSRKKYATSHFPSLKPDLDHPRQAYSVSAMGWLGLAFAALTCGVFLGPISGARVNSRSCIRPAHSDVTVYNFTLPDLPETRNVSLSEYEGKILLLVNVATY